ncbi:MAG: 30S ribosomal protein S12 methylthiotransferase RimO [bacterium]|nr:30S ribosomal protein S12 methylthiotransferase RimO [bacterium]
MSEALKVGLISLGCARNRVDSEVMLGLVGEAGFSLTAFPDQADVLIVNTCGFIAPARAESLEAIRELGRWKREGACRAFLVAGCLAQREGTRLLQRFPEVDGLLGTADYPRIVEAIRSILAGDRPRLSDVPGYLFQEAPPRLVTTGPSAYLKVAEGCPHGCTFCAIPRLRGPLRSRRPVHIMAEARQLVAQGIKELVLVAQDTTAYGWDLRPPVTLAALLREMASLDGEGWVRVLYGHPRGVSDELLEVLAGGGTLCRYLDVPFQHAAPGLLRAMGRPDDPEDMLRRVQEWRQAVPGLTLRSSFITGFPGETEADFEILLDFIQEAALDHVGVFVYSREAMTPAARLPGRVPRDLAEERRRRLMAEQRVVSRRKNAAYVGQEIRVLLEARTGSRLRGRAEKDAPEVDGVVRVRHGAPLRPGEFARVRVTGAGAYHLDAVPAGPLADVGGQEDTPT